jgi:hypothetical protein
MKSIDGLYSEYCKRHEDAVIRLQELEVNPQVEYFLAVSENLYFFCIIN